MFKELNPLIHSQLRLAIMTLLLSVEEADFTYLKKKTNATSGNLSVQLDKLNNAGYIRLTKDFVGRKPRTSCRLTETGKRALEENIESLKTYFEF